MPPLRRRLSLGLRLAIVAGNDIASVRTIFRHIWREGKSIDDAVGWSDLCRRIGIADPDTRISEPKVKEELKSNSERALAAGVFGVPSFIIGGELFWGTDATDMMLDYLRDPQRFASGELGRLATLPIGVERPQR